MHSQLYKQTLMVFGLGSLVIQVAIANHKVLFQALESGFTRPSYRGQSQYSFSFQMVRWALLIALTIKSRCMSIYSAQLEESQFINPLSKHIVQFYHKPYCRPFTCRSLKKRSDHIKPIYLYVHLSHYIFYNRLCHMCNSVTYPILRRILGHTSDQQIHHTCYLVTLGYHVCQQLA